MDKQIIEIANEYAEKVRKYLPVEMIVLFGSYAEGTAREYSDIDIAVIVDKLPADYLAVSAELFSLVRGINTRIEPVLLCRQHDKSGFLESVLKRGRIIYQVAA